ncbi:hypothetical protein IX307_000261 [Bacteroides pyogenes]|uniref:Uncharacterized protein n=2 Tax=Bacteroides pyogenes TaxID=310300 RepID=W4PD80_9BACE|nr:hypothetical protein [Bacteroides pyogenes]MBR8705273.1 hypothetical protein [Bacteroides pyogenes]MBR8720318.1 hypothetical protein [Bacteroides pyogenes]MBR8725946.1 hypothetical protein [Bacteroides pyogenes]MBR8739226.1 hypothetical protein [Bacteroides pyogenes]MBR8754903.1 hypothetical protein [Bacteroides pyogenes]
MKTKIVYVMAIALFMAGHSSVFAQVKDNREKKEVPTQEQVIKMHVDRAVKALMLDDATAAKFTPVYEKYLTELRECRLAMNCVPGMRRNMFLERDNTPTQLAEMTDADVAKLLKEQFAQSRKMLDVREKYYVEFSKILSQKQILGMYRMERNNVNKFRREFDRRRGQRVGDGYRQRQKDCPFRK